MRGTSLDGKPVIIVASRVDGSRQSACFAAETESEKVKFVDWFLEHATNDAEVWARVTGFHPEVTSGEDRGVFSFCDVRAKGKAGAAVFEIETESDRLAFFDKLINGVLDPYLGAYSDGKGFKYFMTRFAS